MKQCEKEKKWKLNKKDFDYSVDPRNDFFHFVNGGWIKNNPIPKTETSWGTFYVLRKENKEILHNLLKQLIDKKNKTLGSEARLVRDLYFTGMNQNKRDKDKLKDLEVCFKKIDSLSNTYNLVELIAEFHSIGIGCFWNSFAEQDFNKSTHMQLWLYQGGLGLPDKDYYFPKNKKQEKILMEYKKHISKMFILFGYKKLQATKDANKVFDIEKKIAFSSMNREEKYDYHKQNNKRTLKDVSKNYKCLNLHTYFRSAGLKNIKTLNVAQLEYFSTMNKMFENISILDWKAYLRWCLLNSMAPHLSSDYVHLDFAFYGLLLSGQKENKPQWERVLGLVEGSLPEALGKVYVKKYFSKKAKNKMDTLVDDIIDAYKARIKENEWMGDDTKKMALKKLSTIKRKIGYPEKWKGYKELNLTQVSHVSNIFEISKFYRNKNLKKIGKRVDRTEWHFSPATVNACYDPGLNDITFPAGILQSPFFSEHAPDAINYGAIGSVIGHEITHGFDDTGSHFDAYGNLKNWWTKNDRKKFEKRASILVDQFNNAKLFDGLNVNGKLTLGENIADLGGALLAYDAYISFKKKNSVKDYFLEGFTDEQLFFIGLAIIERGHVTKEAVRQRLITDPHSPPEFRINIPLSNMEYFYKVFDVKENNKLYRNKKERVMIW